MEEGYRCFRVDASIGGAIPDNIFNTHERVRLVAAACKEIREGVGKGDWMIDFHQKFDFADALRCCKLIEDYEPYLVEDPVRDEQALEEIPKLRTMTTCPLAHGEEWGQRWDFHRLLYDKDIDYIRGTLPNVGGITEMLKVMSLCETSAVGIVPHFTGPVATAALVPIRRSQSVLMEYNMATSPVYRLNPDVQDGKRHEPGISWPRRDGGLQRLTQIAESRARPSMSSARRIATSEPRRARLRWSLRSTTSERLSGGCPVRCGNGSVFSAKHACCRRRCRRNLAIIPVLVGLAWRF